MRLQTFTLNFFDVPALCHFVSSSLFDHNYEFPKELSFYGRTLFGQSGHAVRVNVAVWPHEPRNGQTIRRPILATAVLLKYVSHAGAS